MYLLSNIAIEVFFFFFPSNGADAHIWKVSPSGVFSTKYFDIALEGESSFRYPCLHVWLGLAPPQVETLRCLVGSGKVSGLLWIILEVKVCL